MLIALTFRTPLSTPVFKTLIFSQKRAGRASSLAVGDSVDVLFGLLDLGAEVGGDGGEDRQDAGWHPDGDAGPEELRDDELMRGIHERDAEDDQHHACDIAKDQPDDIDSRPGLGQIRNLA